MRIMGNLLTKKGGGKRKQKKKMFREFGCKKKIVEARGPKRI